MKFLTLIWAAIWRKPVRTIFTLLSVVMAFVLFGLMEGLEASYNHMIETARLDRVLIHARFGGQLQLSQRDQIMRVPGVLRVGYWSFLGGYYQNPKNLAGAFMIDRGMGRIWTDFPISREQFDALQSSRTGVVMSRSLAMRWRRKVGDPFPLKSPANSRADGSNSWTFTVLDIVDDFPTLPGGYILGSYDYFDKARPLADQSKVDSFQVIVTDPDRAGEVSNAIDRVFANSTTPTRSVPERNRYQLTTQQGINIGFVTQAIAAAGLFMILFLTGNGIAQSVRERIAEFAVMKTIGFSDAGVMALVFAEAAVPCLMGAAIGLGIAAELVTFESRLLPGVPLPYMSISVFAFAFAVAAAIAFVSAIAPALRLKRLDIATALARR